LPAAVVRGDSGCNHDSSTEKDLAIAQNHGSLDHVLQFANVARPIVRLKEFERSFVDVLDLLPGLACIAFRKIFDQQRYVVSPIAKGRHRNREDIRAVKQVASECACRDGSLQVAIRGRDDSHVNRDGLRSANALELLKIKPGFLLVVTERSRITAILCSAGAPGAPPQSWLILMSVLQWEK
jgi:hypothetical protein